MVRGTARINKVLSIFKKQIGELELGIQEAHAKVIKNSDKAAKEMQRALQIETEMMGKNATLDASINEAVALKASIESLLSGSDNG